jgi:PhnB protein
MKSTTIYLHFNGECREVMDFYGKVFNAIPEFKTYGESGMGGENGEKSGLILHSTLMKGGLQLMASDTNDDMPNSKNGFSISLDCESLEEMEQTFASLGDGGELILAIHDAFWGGKFGMTKDKYGIIWLFSFGAQMG